MALDPNIAALLTVQVSYSRKTGLDKNGQDVWAAPVTLNCYPASGTSGGGGRQIQRKDGTVYVSTLSLYFDAGDETVQGFQLGDKFTAPGIGGGQTLEAAAISPTFSPGPDLGDPMSEWLVEVSL